MPAASETVRSRPVYLDHAATSPLRPEAAKAMWPWMTELWGNPSGAHAVARRARAAVDDARDVLALALGVPASGVVFTSGGTEADNLAVRGASRSGAGVVVTTAVEHPAVLRAAEASGAPLRLVGPDADGVVDLDALADALDVDVAVVSVMLVNNEVGSVAPLDVVADLVRRRAPHAVLHTDAVQALGYLDVATAAGRADLVSISAHKFGGPQGVGVLAVRDGLAGPILHGGSQERGRRPGTHNVAGIVGTAAAAAAAVESRPAESARIAALRDRLVDTVLATVADSTETGARAFKSPHHAHLRFAGVESEALLVLLDDAGVCASAGSACASGAMEPSPVLLAMGIAPVDALGSVRLTLGWTTTEEDIDAAAGAIVGAVGRLRET